MTVEQVRVIISDPMQFSRASDSGDGVNVIFQLPNVPVKASQTRVWLSGTELANPADFVVDEQMGLITFNAAPGVGDQLLVTYQHSLLKDSDIQTFLDLHENNVRRAAASALDTIASSEVLIQKRITMLDLQTDGKAVADALRDHAKILREED